jgi:hypothetical protein
MFSLFFAVSQTGPGGVGNSSSNSIWIDANKLSYSNGDDIGVLDDVSGNSNSFTQFTVSKQPNYVTNVVNGLPVIRFDGVSDDLLSSSISNLESPNVTWFIVYKQNTAKTGCFIGSRYTSQTTKWYSYSLSNGKVRQGHYSPTLSFTQYVDDYSNFNLTSSHVTPTTLTTFRGGNLIQTNTVPYTTPSGHEFVVLGSFPSQTANNKYLDGDIAEVVVYNESLNDLERVIVENYLGAKYNKAIPNDYFSFQGTHNLGVVGIGNDGVDSHTDSKGNDVVEISNPLALSSNEYLFIGHTNIDLLSFITTDLPGSISTHQRWERTWRVDETGDVGLTTLTFDLSGANGFAIPGTYNLLVDDDGDFSNATVVSGTYDAASLTFTADVDLSSGQYFTVSGSFLAPTGIHSVVSGNWNNAATWDCDCVPTLTDSVFIEPTHTVSIDADAFTYDLHVELGATLQMAADFDLDILGDFMIDGALDFSDGRLALIGESIQFVNANGNTVDLNELLIESPNGSNILFMNGEYILNNTLHPNKGVMNVTSGTRFVVNSVSGTTSGRIGVMLPAFTMQGDITVKRFLPAGLTGNRTISSPVIGASLAEWDTDIYISGTGFPDGCAYDGDGCYFSCKRYNGGDFSGLYIDVTDPNETLLNGTGYEMFIGDDINTFSGATISSTGTLRSYNDFSIVSPQIMPGWNIMGNPYASPISFNAIVTSHIGNYFYIYDAASGSYQWYDDGSNTASIASLNNGNVAIGQGFWVYGGGVPSIDFKQSQKTTTATFIRGQVTEGSIYLELTEEGTTYKNVVNLDFNQEALDGKDTLDLLAFTIGKQRSSSIYVKTDAELLAKNYLNTDGRDKIVDLSVKIINDGYFTISATNLGNVYNYANITLVDLATNEIVDLRKSNYTFYGMEDDETRDRFQLILSNESLGDENNSVFGVTLNQELSITQIGNAIDINSSEFIKGASQIMITNLLGQDVLYEEDIQIQQGVNMIYLPGELKGFYLVTVKTSNGVVTKKIIL